VKAIIFVLLGGGLGALMRYGVGLWLKPAEHLAFPIHTFLINVIGCFCIGFVFSFMQKNGFNATLFYFVITGLLGGFTTFSSFSIETIYLIQQHEIGRAIVYVGLSNIVSLIAAWVGYILINGLT
jgi:fluoride exporter